MRTALMILGILALSLVILLCLLLLVGVVATVLVAG